jgi:hypothetical protein
MSDPREQEKDPGFDQTNGLAEGLEGDDGGAVDPSADKNVIGEVIGDLTDPYEGPRDGDEDETSYSEEGRP